MAPARAPESGRRTSPRRPADGAAKPLRCLSGRPAAARGCGPERATAAAAVPGHEAPPRCSVRLRRRDSDAGRDAAARQRVPLRARRRERSALPGRDVRAPLRQPPDPRPGQDSARRAASSVSGHPAGGRARVLGAHERGVARPELLGAGRVCGGEPQPPRLREQRRQAFDRLAPRGDVLLGGHRVGRQTALV